MPLSALDQTPAIPSGAHSLAHELAVALMPEPVGGSDASRLLAEEFGIEYDEGAEGTDDDLVVRQHNGSADELNGDAEGDERAIDPVEDNLDDDKRDRGSDEDEDDATRRAALARDAMEVLSQNLASTDKFLAHLRAVDVPPPTSPSPTFAVEGLASDVIRRVNDAVREREGQLRELIAYDRDLKRISGEVGGADVLGDLAPLEDFVVEEESSDHRVSHAPNKLDPVVEEDENDRGDGDSLYVSSLPSSPQKATFSSTVSPPSSAPLPAAGHTISAAKSSTPSAITSLATVVPSLVNLRVHTASLLSSLTTISEQAQVNGAATADAGRKIRSLKNRLGGWKVEWESAERSRTKIERWEEEGKTLAGGRIDGRAIVAEHLRAFEKAIADAGVKTQAIMAR
ncbi:hypothetical protein PISMIDRAFT_101269 [Pisolithus microcarpus 441]|uniref:Uncharacterized protein n=1 Tax=Pisolithus microcarpus 441 TaxID=765257 RepID=A0A0C9ZTU3_9AGAM|nr:hypothetical protein PISMIDRAFT_101269 [Pisolithus microcarpus 441]